MVRRLLRGVRRYGWGGTLRASAWVLASAPIFGRGYPLRTLLRTGGAFFFRLFGISRIFVRVNGLPLAIDPRDEWALRAYGFSLFYDWQEISLVRQKVSPEAVLIDVGANCGVWSLALASHFKKVIAVEPDRRCCFCLEASVRRNKIKNVRVVQAALFDCSGQTFFYPGKKAMGDGRTYPVGDGRGPAAYPVRSLRMDDLLREEGLEAERSFFIKLDVQGAEPAVIRGMGDLLDRCEDLILWTEVTEGTLSDAGSSEQEYLSMLRSLDFVPVDLRTFGSVPWEGMEKRLLGHKDHAFRYACEVSVH